MDLCIIERLANCWFFYSFNYFPRRVWLNVHNSFNLYSLLLCFWLHRETPEKKNWAFERWLNPCNILIFCFGRNKSNFCTVMLKCTKDGVFQHLLEKQTSKQNKAILHYYFEPFENRMAKINIRMTTCIFMSCSESFRFSPICKVCLRIPHAMRSI